ncbi:MAG: hypothetical protein HQL33_10530 [Alphaproteobacteria bacterium]|nr:hypothetical protein [Alphaproteobacteria bacterium]
MSFPFVLAGVLGACLAFAANPWPALGMRLRNAGLFLAVLAAATAAEMTGIADGAWTLPLAWWPTMAALDISHRWVAGGEWVLTRTTAVFLAALTALLLGGGP